MTACLHFRGLLHNKGEPCNEHTVGKPKVVASEMPNHVPGFDTFNEEGV